MNFDRPRIKEMAKVLIREAQPRPWKILLAYTLIVSAVPLLFSLVTVLPAMFRGFLSSSVSFGYHREYTLSTSAGSLAIWGLQLLLSLFNALMQMGYRTYCLKLWRREKGGYQDLFQGFRMPGKTLALFGLEVLFSFLWALPGILILVLLAGIAATFLTHSIDLFLFVLIGYFGFFAYLLNRVLRYTLAYHLLLDHPDWTAREALRESKVLMEGRRWSYFVLELSFLGWGLLVCLIAYVVLLVGMLICSLGLSPLLQTASPALFTLVILCVILLVFLASAPLSLWLQAYSGISLAGFYDCAAGRPLVPPAPPWQSSVEEAPRPPEPWSSPEGPAE